MGHTLRFHITGPNTDRRGILALTTPLWLGRDPSCDLVLPSELVSRRHLVIFQNEGQLWLQDHSSNGSWLNTTKLGSEPVQVSIHPQIDIGPFRITLQAAPQTSPPPPPPKPAAPTRSTGKATPLTPTPPSSTPAEHLFVRADTPVPAPQAAPTPDLRSKDPANLVQPLRHPPTTAASPLPKPLATLMARAEVRLVFVQGNGHVFVKPNHPRQGSALALDPQHDLPLLEAALLNLARPCTPPSVVQGHLPDGTHFCLVRAPMAVNGPYITLRKSPKVLPKLQEIARRGVLSPDAGRLLQGAVRIGCHVILCGATQDDSRDLLWALAQSIPMTERVVALSQAIALQLPHPHLVHLLAKHRDRQALRTAIALCPERLVVDDSVVTTTAALMDTLATGPPLLASIRESLRPHTTPLREPQTSNHFERLPAPLAHPAVLVFAGGHPYRILRICEFASTGSVAEAQHSLDLFETYTNNRGTPSLQPTGNCPTFASNLRRPEWPPLLLSQRRPAQPSTENHEQRRS